MRLIALHNATGLRLVDIAQHTALERPTAHRVLQALVQTGLVRKDPTTRRYTIGPTSFEIASIAAPAFDLITLSRPAMRQIALKTGDNVYLSEQRGLDILFIERLFGSFPVQIQHLTIGLRGPLGISSGGVAILGALPEQEAEHIIAANTARYPTLQNRSASEVRAFVAQCRREGCVLNHVGIVDDALSVAVAITNRDARPVGALSIAAPRERMSLERQHELIAQLSAGARMVSDEIHRATRT